MERLSSQGLRVLAYCTAVIPPEVEARWAAEEASASAGAAAGQTPAMDWSDVSVADVAGEAAAQEGGENAGATRDEGALPRSPPHGPSTVEGGPSRLSPYLTLTCLVAILDPPRPECIQSIKEAHAAGVMVKMITGDHRETALAIGRALGLAEEGSPAYTGPELDRMGDEQFALVVKECNVFARAR